METVLAVMALLFVLFVALGVYAVVKVVGVAKRGVDRTITQARRTVEDSALRAKSYAQPGPVGELAQLRLRLRTTMRATQDALHAEVAQDESLKESMALFKRLSVHGHELDNELKRLESEPDRAALADRLPELRARTRRIIDSADALRWAARDRAHRFADDDLDSLSTQIDMEAGALRHWVHDSQPPHRAPRSGPATGGAGPSSGRTGSSSGRSGSSPGGTAGSAAGERSGPERQQASRGPGAGAPDATRPAISPAVRPPTHRWQKQTRPENTT